MRSFVRRLALLQEAGGKPFGQGLINENGKPAWEDFSQEELHEFRRFVFEKLSYRYRQNRKPDEGNHPGSPDTG